MPAPFVIGLAGTIGSGKDTVAGMLSEVLRADVGIISFSRLLIEEKCAPFQIPPTRENLQRIGLETPPEWFHERAAAHMAESSKPAFAIPNIRRLADAAFIRRRRYHCLIGVAIDEPVAYERVRKRMQDEGCDLDRSDFRAMRSAPIESEIPIVLGLADITLDNNGSLQDFRKHLWAHREDLRCGLNRAALDA